MIDHPNQSLDDTYTRYKSILEKVKIAQFLYPAKLVLNWSFKIVFKLVSNIVRDGSGPNEKNLELIIGSAISFETLIQVSSKIGNKSYI